MKGALSTEEFQERILAIMDQKHHWAWPYFSGPDVTKPHLQIHYRQEWAVYVRDFPVFLGRIYGQSPPQDIRSVLAENIYEEDTGRLSLGRSHPDLFLTMMQGLGFNAEAFHDVDLLPPSLTYRKWLEGTSAQSRWILGVAALTIFVEGSMKDRQELKQPAAPKAASEIEQVIAAHPLVQYHGLAPEALALVRAHQMVECGHRHAAYSMVLTHARQPEEQHAVLAELEKGLALWLQYRDGVARACGLQPA